LAERVCPFWVGYLLASPLRRLLQDPEKILLPYVKPGMIALDVGCAMGFFSLPLARMVGERGKVICVDLQEKMLLSLRRRALKTGVADRVFPRLGGKDSLGLQEFEGKIDFALALAVVHEVPDAGSFFGEISKAMKTGSGCLVAEPRWHVSPEEFEATLSVARDKGFQVADRPRIAMSRSALLVKMRDEP
jgi:2-polyprenyl-3-methyl-5-hydroxy-6-metoxy-1,4-benzoquinol methylase